MTVSSRFRWIRGIHLALFGSLLLAGCPAADLNGGSSSVAGVTVQGVQPGVKSCSVPSNSDVLVARVLELVNQQREERGLHALGLNPVLSTMADDYACEMIEGGFFDHTNPITGEGPGQRAVNAGYVFLSMGENLAGGQQTPEQVISEWMASPGHRDNILAAQWKEMGLAVRTGGDLGVYWVQEFGNPP